jgi:glycine cleavage system H protein
MRLHRVSLFRFQLAGLQCAVPVSRHWPRLAIHRIAATLLVESPGTKAIVMSNVPADLHYTKTHQWVRQMPDGLLEVGISDYAQNELGDLVSVRVPVAGRSVASGEVFAELESAKTTSEVPSPVAGEVSAVNAELASAPDLINQDPYGKGWLARVRPSGSAWKAQLLSASAYEQLLEAQPQ